MLATAFDGVQRQRQDKAMPRQRWPLRREWTRGGARRGNATNSQHNERTKGKRVAQREDDES